MPCSSTKHLTIKFLVALWLLSGCNRKTQKEISTGNQITPNEEIKLSKKEIAPEVEAPPQTVSSRIAAYYQKLRESGILYAPFSIPSASYLNLLNTDPLHEAITNGSLYSHLPLKPEAKPTHPQQAPALWELMDPTDGSKIYLCGTRHYVSNYNGTILDRATKAIQLADYFTAEGDNLRLSEKFHKTNLKVIDNVDKLINKTTELAAPNTFFKKFICAMAGSKKSFIQSTKNCIQSYEDSQNIRDLAHQINEKNIAPIWGKAKYLIGELKLKYNEASKGLSFRHILGDIIVDATSAHSFSIDEVLQKKAVTLGKCNLGTKFLDFDEKANRILREKEEFYLNKMRMKEEDKLLIDILVGAVLIVVPNKEMKYWKQEQKRIAEQYLQEKMVYDPTDHQKMVQRHIKMTLNILKEPKYRGKTLFIAVGQAHLLGPESMRVQLHRIGYTQQRPILTVEDLS